MSSMGRLHSLAGLLLPLLSLTNATYTSSITGAPSSHLTRVRPLKSPDTHAFIRGGAAMTAGGSPHGSSSTTSILQSQKHRIALACLLDVALNAAKTDKVACFEWATDGDAFACLGARAQRAFYEAILAALALAGDHPSSLLLLAVTAALIGIGDLIFHAPLYALTAHRRDCGAARSTWGWCIDKACTSIS